MTLTLHRPTRMCVGCRRRFDDGSLVRLVVSNHAVYVSPTSAGRGAWLCAHNESCAEKAVSQGALRRSLRKEITITASDLMTLMRSSMEMKG